MSYVSFVHLSYNFFVRLIKSKIKKVRERTFAVLLPYNSLT